MNNIQFSQRRLP